MDKRLITVIIMAVVVALVITAIFYQITVGRRPTQTAVAKKELVVAKEDLAMRSEIQRENLLVRDYPVEAYPQGAFADIEDVIVCRFSRKWRVAVLGKVVVPPFGRGFSQA